MARPTSCAAVIFQNTDGAEFGVDLDFRHVGAEAVDGVGSALAVFVESAGGRDRRWLRR